MSKQKEQLERLMELYESIGQMPNGLDRLRYRYHMNKDNVVDAADAIDVHRVGVGKDAIKKIARHRIKIDASSRRRKSKLKWDGEKGVWDNEVEVYGKGVWDDDGKSTDTEEEW